MKILHADPGVDLQLVVCGMHLMPRFGSTWKEIEADGIPIAARVELPLQDDSAASAAKATGLGVIGFSDALSSLKPDILVLIGDRYEMLAAAIVAMLFNLPIAHIHGGEVTVGAFDDAIRHSLTKMALLHFVAAEPYRRRVIQLGEDPKLVFTVGAPGLDQLPKDDTPDRATISRELGIAVDRGFLLVTLHPATTQPESDAPTVEALIRALDQVKDRNIVFTGVNADPGHNTIDKAIREFVAARPNRARLFVSLGSQRYFAALRYADAVVGNSSSGIIEAPAVGTPSVNVGGRQAGRLRAASVVDCESVVEAIAAALRIALTPEFRERARKSEPPYGRGGASARIAKILREIVLDPLRPKRFRDLLDS
jgi:UDP-hydrolysing UDP-N-acetyl-D-glucosamine 2-epimerase